MIDLVEHDWL